MDEATLAGIEQDFMQAVKDLGELLGATNADSQAVDGARYFITGSAGIVSQLAAEVRRLSAALADANKTIRALAAAPSGEPHHQPKETK